MLISKSMQKLVRVLVNNKEKTLTLREISREANASVGITSKIINNLEKTGYLKKVRGGFKVSNFNKLLNAWAYCVSVNELDKVEFSAAERPQYLIKKIAEIADKNNLKYAFTLFSATEIAAPYVSPNETHLYILEKEKEMWEKIMPKNNIFLAEKGNIICFLVDEKYFYNAKKIRGIKIVSLPQLYADLFSFSARGEEAAQEVLKIIKSEENNNEGD